VRVDTCYITVGFCDSNTLLVGVRSKAGFSLKYARSSSKFCCAHRQQCLTSDIAGTFESTRTALSPLLRCVAKSFAAASAAVVAAGTAL
jgi:hypothetical protein